ncbi:MAG: hypothetical protein FJW63_07900 [Actinobacteria bacterium]|nr:hypothetical protein [Actinomycetota bacterium]
MTLGELLKDYGQKYYVIAEFSVDCENEKKELRDNTIASIKSLLPSEEILRSDISTIVMSNLIEGDLKLKVSERIGREVANFIHQELNKRLGL